MSQATYITGDVRDVLATIPDGSVDLVMTSPPFLALRSYLPADHPDKHREIGAEPDPAAFLATLLGLTAEWRRVLAPHGSICVELGDTYSGSGGAGGDYNADGLRDGQAKFDGSNSRRGKVVDHDSGRRNPSPGWPLAKSLCGIPHLYHLSLAYGRNLLTGEPCEPWRVRNVVAWCRPNPPVGALGDKFRPATSYLTIACPSAKRYFDLDAVRTTPKDYGPRYGEHKVDGIPGRSGQVANPLGPDGERIQSNPAGAPPLDWWEIPTTPYSGKTSTSRRVPCGPDDGGERTASPDCPVHGGLPGQVPKALRGGRAGSQPSRTSRSGARHEQGQLLDSEATDATPDHSGSSPTPTTDSSLRECDPAATSRSTADHRTDLAPETNPAGMPFAGTSGHTDGTSGQPESDGHRPCTPESRTSADESPGSRTHRTSADTAGTGTAPESSAACTCSFHRLVTESTSHYAVYPPALLERPIKAMVPQRVCTVCGEPSRRIVERDEEPVLANLEARGDRKRDGRGDESGVGNYGGFTTTTTTTTGWTDCGHGDAWRNGLVLDPFGGSGTTGMVATGNGRDALLIDIDERNVHLASDRIGMFLTHYTLDEWRREQAS